MVRRFIILFRFTRSEQRSLVLLCSLLVVFQVFSQVLNPDKSPDVLSAEIGGDSQDSVKSSNSHVHKPIDIRTKEGISLSQKKVLEINSTDSAGFIELYGIGPVFAGRIVKYRKLLGGYFRCDQLLEVYGMDSIRYNGFKSNIRVDGAVISRMDINTSSFKELLRHPYFDYNTVKKVVNYRDRNGPLEAPGDLWADSVLNVEDKKKMLPYLK